MIRFMAFFWKSANSYFAYPGKKNFIHSMGCASRMNTVQVLFTHIYQLCKKIAAIGFETANCRKGNRATAGLNNPKCLFVKKFVFIFAAKRGRGTLSDRQCA